MHARGKIDGLTRGFSAGLLLLWLTGAQAADKPVEVSSDAKPVIAPPSSWVLPHFFDRQSVSPQPETSADQRWLLLEREVNAGTNETFIHCARQILSVAGVQNGSDLKIDFNPSYQTLTLHWARLWRGTNHLNQLTADKVRVVRQEREMENQILNGEQTAILVMDDVRVGDIVDYAYSIKGENPVFNGKFSTQVPLQLQEPVGRMFTRVIWPAQRRFYLKAHNSSLAPVVTKSTNLIECVWDERQVPALHLEDSLPVWCDPEPAVQLSEFKTWAEVNQWALTLFQNNSSLSPDILGKIKEWQPLPTREEQVTAVLRFVQDEIRYFGIEIGISTEKPADPATVYSRRFGDCKDKSLLFVTLLHSLGIEAYPVLVNTQARQTIEDWQPAADLFDHCIAVVRVDNKIWWVDPTAGYQRGPLALHYLPNYARGLVIALNTSALTVIPQTAGLPLTTTTEYFDLGRKSGTSDLKVVTVAEGRDADRLRAQYATTKRSDIEKDNTHFYADAYPGTTMAAPIQIVDDEAQNRFKTTEFYSISGIWIKSDNDGRYRCDFYPVSIAALNKKPLDTQRSLPLAVSFPQHQILRTEISVPTSWTYSKENKNVLDPAFSFRKQSHREDNKLILEYDYQSLADFVPDDRTEEYFQNLALAAKCFGDGIVWK